jgi:hypothetical protein
MSVTQILSFPQHRCCSFTSPTWSTRSGNLCQTYFNCRLLAISILSVLPAVIAVRRLQMDCERLKALVMRRFSDNEENRRRLFHSLPAPHFACVSNHNSKPSFGEGKLPDASTGLHHARFRRSRCVRNRNGFEPILELWTAIKIACQRFFRLSFAEFGLFAS